jgi:2-deoxy-D-gluconate 3-dehydrogenase
VLVNNAGMIRRAPAEEAPAEDWNTVLALNLTAPFLLAQAFARPLLEAGGRGSIINVVSMNSFHGGMNVAAYTASKHGLLPCAA